MADDLAAEAAAWQAFTRQLAARLADAWPAMAQRLADRFEAFIELTARQAGEHGFALAAAVARYANLCIVWGPGFHQKPGFEWAQSILATARGHEWLCIHQLVQRSVVELAGLPAAQVAPQTLAQVDAQLMDFCSALGARGRLHAGPAPALPRVSCDIEAAELRLPGAAPAEVYELAEGRWRRSPLGLPPPVRVLAGQPLAPRLWMLSPQAEQGPPAQLQWRLRPHRACDPARHPWLGFTGPDGQKAWPGPAALSASWAVPTREQRKPQPGVGAVVAEETSPEFYRLELHCCGLRDEGAAVGPQRALLTVLPAEQWWLAFDRALPGEPQALLPDRRQWVPGTTRCQLECEGRPTDGADVERQFRDGLDAEVALALNRLADAWAHRPGLVGARCQAALGLLVGHAAISWGWCMASSGMGAPAWMRVVARLDLKACEVDVELGGELALAGTACRVRLRVAGQVPLAGELRRETARLALPEVMQAAATSWRLPFDVEIEPVAGAGPLLLSLHGAASGALVGEAGLRPCLSGSSGFEWFARMEIEPVTVTLELHDPAWGRLRSTLCLLPFTELLNWSVR